MNRLATLILIAFLPAIAPAKGGHGGGSHSGSHGSHSSGSLGGHSHGAHGSSSLHHGAHFGIHRSSAANRSFQASNPCPANGKASGGCKGYVIDNKTSLACGGADAPENMQWQTAAGATLKDKKERAGCR
jgi:hypothetical protein